MFEHIRRDIDKSYTYMYSQTSIYLDYIYLTDYYIVKMNSGHREKFSVH